MLHTQLTLHNRVFFVVLSIMCIKNTFGRQQRALQISSSTAGSTSLQARSLMLDIGCGLLDYFYGQQGKCRISTAEHV